MGKVLFLTRPQEHIRAIRKRLTLTPEWRKRQHVHSCTQGQQADTTGQGQLVHTTHITTLMGLGASTLLRHHRPTCRVVEGVDLAVPHLWCKCNHPFLETLA